MYALIAFLEYSLFDSRHMITLLPSPEDRITAELDIANFVARTLLGNGYVAPRHYRYFLSQVNELNDQNDEET